MLWVDKHRPCTLDKLDVHHELPEKLKGLVSAGDFPHLLFYGPSGAGKKTRVMALLREIFGAGVERLKVEHRMFKLQSRSSSVELTTISSPYHIELNPSDVGINDRYVVQEIVKEMAQSGPLELKSAASGFKVVVLNEVDRLTREAQHALRRTMEKYMRTCRVILISSTASRVIDPVRSRCLMIRVPLASKDEVVSVLHSVAKKERIELPDRLAAEIAQSSGRNLRKAILMLEAARVQCYPFSENLTPVQPDWERYIHQLAIDMLEEQSPRKLLVVRTKMYDLLSNCIPADIIIKTLATEIMSKCDGDLKAEIIHWAAYYEHRICNGNKPIYHLEAFAAKVMSIYKDYLSSMMFD